MITENQRQHHIALEAGHGITPILKQSIDNVKVIFTSIKTFYFLVRIKVHKLVLGGQLLKSSSCFVKLKSVSFKINLLIRKHKDLAMLVLFQLTQSMPWPTLSIIWCWMFAVITQTSTAQGRRLSRYFL